MGTTINGVGNPNSHSMMTGTLTIKNINDSNARVAAMRKTQKKVTKPLNYNHREISGQLTRAKKAQSAASVLTRAKSKLAVLQRAAGSGQYDQKEVATAIAHARRMVRCAQLKVRNLKQEEQEQKAQKKETGAKKQQRQGEVKRRVAAKERELKKKVAIEENQEILKEKRKRNEMAQKRRMHRSQERGKITEADMKYIKAMSENGNGSAGCSYCEDSGIVLDISGTAMALAELAMMQQASAEIEMEAEAEVEAEMAVEAGNASSYSGGAIGGMSVADGSASTGAETAVAVDVSV